jgi:hypothetical protein
MVSVMNADGSHQANFYGTSQAATDNLRDECWSPNGASVGFIHDNGNTTAPVAAIKAIDISVNSSGTVVGSNVRTIYNAPANTGITPGTAWSSTATMGKYAFATYNPSNSNRTLWVVSQTGGSPIKVWGSDSTYVKENGSVMGHRQTLSSATWSPDDEHLAAVRADSAGTTTPTAMVTIMIFRTSDNGLTWSYDDSIKVAGGASMPVSGLEWSRNGNGINKLAYNNFNDGFLYYVDPSTNAVPFTNSVPGRFPTWSTNNSVISYWNSSYYHTVVPFTTTVSYTFANPAYYQSPAIHWKR